MRKPREQPAEKTSGVEFHPVDSRELVRIGPDHECWRKETFECGELIPNAIVWLKPPPGVDPSRVQLVLTFLKARGSVAKLLPPERVDPVAVEARPNRPERKLSEAREIIAEELEKLCKQPAFGVVTADAMKELEPYLSEGLEAS